MHRRNMCSAIPGCMQTGNEINKLMRHLYFTLFAATPQQLKFTKLSSTDRWLGKGKQCVYQRRNIMSEIDQEYFRFWIFELVMLNLYSSTKSTRIDYLFQCISTFTISWYIPQSINKIKPKLYESGILYRLGSRDEDKTEAAKFLCLLVLEPGPLLNL